MTERAFPEPDGETTPFWDGIEAGKLRIQRCLECRRHVFYPRSICPNCMGSLEWVDAAGTGTVHSFTVVHRAPAEEYRSEVPYTVALIDLDEGVRMMSRLVDCDPSQVRIGAAVEVQFRELGGGPRLHVFKLRGESA